VRPQANGADDAFLRATLAGDFFQETKLTFLIFEVCYSTKHFEKRRTYF
jgi:hypothetical protein